MKKFCKILSAVVMMLVSISVFASPVAGLNNNVPAPVKKKDIIITTIPTHRHFEHSMPGSVEAYYYPESSTVEVECFGVGNVIVCVYDLRGQMCGYTEFNSDERPVERIELEGTSGLSSIAIYTDNTYSVGVFWR